MTAVAYKIPNIDPKAAEKAAAMIEAGLTEHTIRALWESGDELLAIASARVAVYKHYDEVEVEVPLEVSVGLRLLARETDYTADSLAAMFYVAQLPINVEKDQTDQWVKAATNLKFFAARFCNVHMSEIDVEKLKTTGLVQLSGMNPRHIAAYYLHIGLFECDKNIAIVNRGLTDQLYPSVFSIIKELFGKLPKWLQRECVEWKRYDIRFGRGVRISQVVAGGLGLKGLMFNSILLDEYNDYSAEAFDNTVCEVQPRVAVVKNSQILAYSSISVSPDGNTKRFLAFGPERSYA